jgi:hypothetical protein
LRFNTSANALLFARTDAISPLPTAHPLLAEVHQRLASEHLRRLDYAQTSRQAVRSLTERGRRQAVGFAALNSSTPDRRHRAPS